VECCDSVCAEAQAVQEVEADLGALQANPQLLYDLANQQDGIEQAEKCHYVAHRAF